MSKKTAFRIFLIGTLSSAALFLWATFFIGIVFLAGVLTTVTDLLTIRPKVRAQA